MQNPFESGHIKNYILAYVSVVVIMVLFFIASSLFLDIESVEQKVFYEDENLSTRVVDAIAQKEQKAEKKNSKFKLLEYGY